MLSKAPNEAKVAFYKSSSMILHEINLWPQNCLYFALEQFLQFEYVDVYDITSLKIGFTDDEKRYN